MTTGNVKLLLNDPMNFNVVNLDALTTAEWDVLKVKYGNNNAFRHLIILHNGGRENGEK